LAYSATEENNCVEVFWQVGSELDLGYEGLAIFDLICHMAGNSAYNQLRTVEQLGYIVSTYARKTAGSAWGMTTVVQGGVALPEQLEERIEAWLVKYRQELEAMEPSAMATEASAVVSQLLEVETRMSQEVTRVWGEILNTEGLTSSLRTPAYDRLQRLADVLDVDNADTDEAKEDAAKALKVRVLEFFDQHFAVSAVDRRVLSTRVYSQANREAWEAAIGQAGVLHSFDDVLHLKAFLPALPTVPYWRVDNSTVTGRASGGLEQVE
jgi:hypothetical protein